MMRRSREVHVGWREDALCENVVGERWLMKCIDIGFVDFRRSLDIRMFVCVLNLH
jgi:hypothetical protein